jgi:CubicO group peptidase (beta-lactamase class C family)
MKVLYLALLSALMAAPAQAQDTMPPALTSKIDAAVTEALQTTGAPSASIAVVKGGQLVYTRAYGLANVENKAEATPAMRYSIGSISKQFAASAILLLAEEGKLSLDDKVGEFLPGLTRGGDVTLRQLLSMTAGYQDYWPQDYVMPGMLKPVTPEEIVNRWARIPLDFEPGTAWQYSNTNYVIIGLVVQKAAGQPLFDFLQQRIFGTLGMTSIQNIDEAALGPADASRYTRMASGPVRPAPKEGPRLDLRGRRTGHDGLRSRKVGHLADQEDRAEAGVVPRARDGDAARQRRRAPATASASRCACREDIASSRTAAKSPASPRRTSSIRTMASPWSC